MATGWLVVLPVHIASRGATASAQLNGIQMDLTPFTGAAGDLTTAIATVGAASVTIYVATKSFGFVKKWIGRIFSNATGSSV